MEPGATGTPGLNSQLSYKPFLDGFVSGVCEKDMQLDNFVFVCFVWFYKCIDNYLYILMSYSAWLMPPRIFFQNMFIQHYIFELCGFHLYTLPYIDIS